MTTYDQEYNKKLVQSFPFLLPRNVWDDSIDDDYDYEYTVLDEMPDGWRKAFGEMMCEEIKQELLRFGKDVLDNYRVLDVKEKYGQLRWYDNGHPIGSNIGDIIGKYETLSENICMICGKPDVPMCGSFWISPFCFRCYLKDDRNRASDWENWFDERGSQMSSKYKYTAYTRSGDSKKIVIDISETADKIRKRWTH